MAGPPEIHFLDELRYLALMSRRATTIATICGSLAAVGFLIGIYIDHSGLRMLTKPWPVLLMAVVVFAAGRGRYQRLIVAGLLACLAGDVLLELSPATFLAGVGAFFVGHVLYTIAYLGRSRRWRPLMAVPCGVSGVAVIAVLRPGLEAANMFWPVAIYTMAIMTMVWRAAACWEDGGASDVTLLAFAGAVLFAVSDTLIAVDRFHQPIAGVRYPIILLYWLGQLGITLSALRFQEPGRERNTRE